MAEPANHDMMLECSKCKRCWIKLFNLPMLLHEFVHELQNAKCPNCGNQAKLFMLTGERYKEAKAKLTP